MTSTLKRKAGDTPAASDAKKPKQNGSITSFFGAPKPVPGAAKAAAAPEVPAAKFDKAKWVAGLTPEQKDLLKLEIETLHESWLALLKDEVTSKEFLDLKRFLNRETEMGRKWFPPKEDVYSWSRHCPFNQGQGRHPRARTLTTTSTRPTGLAFLRPRPDAGRPPSLKNIAVAAKPAETPVVEETKTKATEEDDGEEADEAEEEAMVQALAEAEAKAQTQLKNEAKAGEAAEADGTNGEAAGVEPKD
ncbi:uracil-DNA glycosylase [Verticillium alfalfae VaMs.102]|uniref:Uracil-DNA glycosylase n=1 Tax=Verticillium alfalfae (strain VaMs.102 / ATCC MYA-4576 / FGSC 10136) TaxID=526221 RepID=C9SH11_VERA1|nr:uracil-DNA glycosylase [Verticillium alfalfae VaMs.102]EEY17605.1 uracil-DNA glycosylase [Verticillium alfalfae VaMs.102]